MGMEGVIASLSRPPPLSLPPLAPVLPLCAEPGQAVLEGHLQPIPACSCPGSIEPLDRCVNVANCKSIGGAVNALTRTGSLTPRVVCWPPLSVSAPDASAMHSGYSPPAVLSHLLSSCSPQAEETAGSVASCIACSWGRTGGRDTGSGMLSHGTPAGENQAGLPR